MRAACTFIGGISDNKTPFDLGGRRGTRIPPAVAFALRANCGPRWLSGFLTMFMAFLLREVPFGQDGSYSEDGIIGRINSDLANELGNLAQRSLSMVNKNLDARVPEPGAFSAEDSELLGVADGLLDRVRAAFDEQAMHLGLEAIWLMLGAANRYFSAQEPWVLRKSEAASDQERFRTVLYVTLEAVRVAALLVQPVMPTAAGRLLDLLGQHADDRDFASLATRLAPGTELPAPVGVFPRYEPPAE